MSLTPLDIHHKEFKSARFGGYNEEEVDSFLDQVADELERLIHENEDAKGQMEQLKARVAEFEEMRNSLQNALIAATRSAEVVTEQARQESEAMIAKAQEEADSLIRSAQEQARQMTLRAQNERQKLERSFAHLKQIKRRYLLSIKEMAEAHLAQVAELEAREDADADADDSQFRTETVKVPNAARPVGGGNPPVVEPPVLLDEGNSVTEGNLASEPGVVLEPAESPAATERGVTGKSSDNPVETDRAAMAPARIVEDVGGDSEPLPTAETPPVTADEQGDTPAPPSSNLVDEVLAMDNGDDVYAGFEDGEGEENARGKKGRKQKKDKHFFWE